jgi:hypothetical protein
MTDATRTGEPTCSPQPTTLNLKFQVNPSGIFEIIAINAGVAQGSPSTCIFKPDVLKESMPLWDKVQCFVDHDGTRMRSITQLAGVCSGPTWDDLEQGIRLTLITAGPAGELVNELGRTILSGDIPDLNAGFSADVFLQFEIDGKTVKRILKVYSLDVVYNPARGGKFLRVLNQAQGNAPSSNPQGGNMTEPINSQPAASAPDPNQPVAPWHSSELEAARTILGQGVSEVERAAQELKSQQDFRRQMCALLLEQGVSASRLPQAAQEYVRAQYTEKAVGADGNPVERVKLFNPSDLTKSIEEVRSLAGSMASRGIVGASGIVGGMFTADEQLQAAVDDMFGAPRDEKLKSLKVARLSGIRELYLMLTGDDDMRGAYVPSRVRFQHTTATFTGLVKNALNKVLVNHWEALGRAGYDWWTKIATIEHFTSINGVTWIIFGTVASLPTVAEGAEYTELQVGDSPETSSFTKYGGYVGITLEALDRDETRKLAAVPRELANAGIRNISSLVAAVFSANAGLGPTLADGGTLFNATAVTALTGHANYLTTALSAAQWETVSAAMYNQPMLVKNAATYYGTGKKMALNPKYCLVPRALELTSRMIFEQPWVQTVQVHAETTLQGKAETVVVPDWTDTTDWAAVADPMLCPGIMIAERFGIMPEIFVAGDETSPAVFMNDESRIKVRHFLAVGVADFRPLANNHV